MDDKDITEDMERLLEAKEKLSEVSSWNNYMNYGKYRTVVDALEALIEDYNSEVPPIHYT